ncbi:unnamed protein product [Schistosoma curassoni]|uniref:DNA topoisomerase n=1 Tax=Schistosoma curassoni TaxID=6186 RepID=A0A183K1K7_9TREM|nr:unnamed protein product [Schistosoma curassoni]
MKNLREPNKHEALSVDARQELDLRIGCAFTRFQTKFFQIVISKSTPTFVAAKYQTELDSKIAIIPPKITDGNWLRLHKVLEMAVKVACGVAKRPTYVSYEFLQGPCDFILFKGKYGDLNSNLVSFGPCQTPTLGFCVKRHDQIQSFKPETFWRITVSGVDDTGGVLEMSWNRDRIFDKEAASVFLGRVKSSKTAEVVQVSVKQKIKPRPQGLNTVEMLRVASAGLGIGPHSAMAIAERLYTSGYINYPRTETTAYPNTFDLRGLLQQQVNNPVWGDLAREILKSGLTPPRAGHDAGDHPPIAPMRFASSQELGHEAYRLYEYITQHFIATVMTVSVGDGELFTISGLKVVDPGFTRILTWQAIEDKSLPITLLNQGYQFNLLEEPSLVEGQTGPPDYLTEAELITAMERHGIGTDASIPTHIENIVQRGYVQLLSGRKLQPTPLGIVLVHGYQTIDAELVLPHMRRAVEEQLNHIARGHAKYDLVLQFVLAIFAAKYRYFVEHINGMDQLFEVSFTTLASSGKPLSRCGKCHRYLKFIDSRPQRLHCSICNETYTLPQNGTIRPYKTEKCPLDKFELLCYTQGGKGRNMVFCPYCFSHPPFESMPKLSGCNRCPHPTCPQSMESLGVDACPDCPYGILVLDDSNAPKYRFNCNRLVYYYYGKVPNSSEDNSEKISTTFSGCAFCTESLCSLFTIVRKKEAPNNPTVNLRGSRHHSGTHQRGGRRGRSFR